jgi:predicted  nucleic acid-binding Zn-ribbon protein
MPEFNQQKRSYIQLRPDAHPDDQKAFAQVQDHIFQLRDQLQEMKQSKEQGKTEKKGFTQELQGIQVKAVTDPSSLKSGYTIRYNAKTGQFEFGV